MSGATATGMLTRPEGKPQPNLRLVPRDSATLIIIDSDGPSPRVLMGRRHERHVFMPGKFVFPGGRVDRNDGDAAAAEELHEGVAEKLMLRMSGRPSRRRARALALAALRETFEEAGLLIGKPSEVARKQSGDWAAFGEHGLLPCLGDLRYVARAITPPGRPRRFDSRFFVVEHDAIAARLDGGVGPSGELDGLAWLTLDEACALDLPRITRVVLEELYQRLEAGSLTPGADVPFYYSRHGRFMREVL